MLIRASQGIAVMAHRAELRMSEKNSENPTPDSVRGEPFCGVEGREHLVMELRTRAERFYEQARLEQIMQATLIIRPLLAATGPLPEQASKQIH
jgi:hypothetical protein